MKKTIIIAPFYLHNDILKEEKKNNPFIHLKMISKEEILSSYFGKYKKEALHLLMKEEGFDYQKAKSILRILPYVDQENRYIYLKEKLNQKSLLKSNPYIIHLFDNADIKIVGYSNNDKELLSFLNNNHLSYEFVSSQTKEKEYRVELFENGEEEILSSLNKIAHLLDEGVKPDSIYIVCLNEKYYYYLNLYKDSFGFNLNLPNNTNLFSLEFSAQILKRYREIREILPIIDEFDGQDLDDICQDILTLIKNNIIEDFSFEQQYDLFVSLLKETSIKKPIYKDAINVYDHLIYKKDCHIFILSFAQGSFPSLYKDNDLLADQEKERLGLNTSFDNGQISFDLIKDFLSSNNHFYFSFASHLANESYYLSPFVKDFNMEKINGELDNILYSKMYAKMAYSKALDLANIYYEKTADYYSLGKILPLPLKYDNSYTTVNAINPKQSLKYSYSQFKQYYECPFLYYLSRLLEVNDDTETFNLKLGNIAHEIFEKMFDDDFDFEKVYQSTLSKYELNDEEYLLIEGLKPQIALACSTDLNHHQHYMAPNKVLREQKATYVLDDKTILEGKIDNLTIIEDSYLMVVDYKTGSESFDPRYLDYGYSLQIPTYMLLAHSLPSLKDKPIIGGYIQNVIESSFKEEDMENKILPGYLRLNGRTINENQLIQKIDTTFDGITPTFISGLKLIKKEQRLNGYAVSKDEFIDYENKVIELYKVANENIRNNKFEIAPKVVGKNNPCQFCIYKDICFVTNEQIVYLDKEKEEDD